MDCFWQIHTPLLILDWCAKLYEHGGYSGWEKVIQETTYLNLGESEIRNPQTSSVRVKPGCTLYLLKFSGHHLLDSFTADVSALGKHNDQARSLICPCQDMIIDNNTNTFITLLKKYA